MALLPCYGSNATLLAFGVASPLNLGRSVLVIDTELRDTAGRLVARVTQTQAVLPAA